MRQGYSDIKAGGKVLIKDCPFPIYESNEEAILDLGEAEWLSRGNARTKSITRGKAKSGVTSKSSEKQLRREATNALTREEYSSALDDVKAGNKNAVLDLIDKKARELELEREHELNT